MLACSLLEIKLETQLSTHYLRGSLFENLVINEFAKESFNRGEEPRLTFWRDKSGNEVDLLQTTGNTQKAFEIKSGETFSPDYFKGIAYLSKLSGTTPGNCFAVYLGSTPIKSSFGEVISWDNF